MATNDVLIDELTPIVAALGLEIDDVNVSKAGNRRVLAISLDRDGGLDLDLVADASRAISEHLDDSDVMGSAPYVLEVSSRGIDKPLTTAAHWRRNIGRLVKIVGGSVDVVGRIVSSDDAAVVLNVKGQMRTIEFASISKALVQVEFNRADEIES